MIAYTYLDFGFYHKNDPRLLITVGYNKGTSLLGPLLLFGR